MLVELLEVRFRHLDGARLLLVQRRLEPANVRSVRAAIAYSTTLGTVKKPPAFLSVCSM